MALRISPRRQRRSSDASSPLWTALIMDDIAGIDGDIERLLDVYSVKHGCSRETASDALVRKLSSFGRGALQLEEAC